MNTRNLLFLSFIASLLQGPLLPQVAAEGFLVVLAGGNITPKVLFALFASGIIFDSLGGKTIGATSFIFLLFALLLYFLRNQIFAKKAIFAALVVFLVDFTRSYFVFGTFSPWLLVFVFVVAYVLFHFAISSDFESEINLR